MKKRLFAAFVSLCLIVSMLPTMAFAEVGVQDSGTTIGASGLCEHHTEHTADCGYTEGTAEIPCSHEHTEECYTEVTSCVHEHTADCYPAESVSENTATSSEPEEAEPTACTHECSEENDCITKTLDCKHEHDEACSYVPATEGTPCTYVCEICNAQDSGNPAAPSDAQPEKCTCETLCTEEEINADCPVCFAEGVKLDEVCTGEAPVPIRSGSAHTHPVCGSSESCTEPDHGTEHTDVTWIEWNETTFLPHSGGNYYLTGNVTLSKTWEAPSEETSLCLNGHSITYENSSDQGSVIKVPSGVTLTITDCANTPGKITGGTGTKTYYNTSILSGGHFGGGIYVEGTLNLYNGSVEENHIPSTDGMRYDGGGGVFVNGKEAYFNMYGGIIQDNAAYTAGAGVLCYKSQFNMYGGEITGHKNPGYDGAVCLDEGSTMTMTGGTIAGNTNYREQIYISKDAKLIVDGSSAVIAEESEQYAIHAFNGGKVEIRNGSIGSEVVILQQSKMTMSDGQILKIRVSRGSNLTVSGGKISEGISLGSEDSDYWGWGTIMLSEAPEISGITLMNPQNVITVTGQLTYLSPIPVTKSGGVLTSGWSAYMDGAAAENYFNCGEYELQQINNEIHLVEAGAHEHGGILFDKDMQSFTQDQYGYYIIDADSNYYLSNNYTIGDTASFDPTLFIGDGTNEVTVNLCLNGYELTRADSPYVDGSIIVVRENATLNLYDCKSTGTITGGTGRTGEKNGNTYSYGGGILVYGTLNMYGGTITGNSANADGVTEGFGGGIYVADGSAFTMYGGSIINNSAKTTGGGVAVAGDGESVPMSEEFGFNETITNWKSGANGGGKMTISNDTDIIVQDNMTGNAASNIYFPASAPNMTVSSLPAQGTQIGIRMETPGQFAAMGTGVDEAQAQTFFTSDDTTYNVLVIEDGLALGKQQNVPTIGINYQTEMLTGFANDGSYTINGQAVTPSADGTIAIQEEWMGTTISIVRKGDGDTVDSNAQNLLIPARPAAPDVTAGIRKINGADTSMEYSSDNGTTWTAFTDETISGISAGTYLVRYRAKADAFAGQSTSQIHVRNSSGGGSSGGGSSSSSKGGSGYTTWILDDIGWWLKYADGSYAKGSITTDAAGNQTEIPYWEFVNGKWFAFGASGYIMTGWIYDPVYKYWFYIDVNRGMLTGWQLLNNKWYYFNPVSDGTRGRLFVNTTTPDGYKVGADGAWIQ